MIKLLCVSVKSIFIWLRLRCSVTFFVDIVYEMFLFTYLFTYLMPYRWIIAWRQQTICRYLQWRHEDHSTSTQVTTSTSAACRRMHTTHFRATWGHVTASEAVWRHCGSTDLSQSTCSSIRSAFPNNIGVISHLVVLTTKVGHVIAMNEWMSEWMNEWMNECLFKTQAHRK